MVRRSTLPPSRDKSMLGNATIQLTPYDCAIYHNAALALTTLADFALSRVPGWNGRTWRRPSVASETGVSKG